MAALIGGILESTDNPEARSIRMRVSEYLLSQRAAEWTFNYWDANSPHYTALAVPNDLDDTFCALSVLHDMQPELFDGDVLAQIVTQLCSVETVPGGPYNTWYTGDKKWADVDPVVNANIHYFLQKQNVVLEKLNSYLTRALHDRVPSNYYPSQVVVDYFLVKSLIGHPPTDMLNILLVELKKDKNTLELAMLVSTLLRLGVDTSEVSESINWIIKAQKSDGSWPAYGLYIDARLTSGDEYAGSPELTTAYCVEAITLYVNARKSVLMIGVPKKGLLIARIHTEISMLPSIAMRAEIMYSLNDVLSGSSERNIIELPYVMADVLKKQKIDPANLEELATMSVWGWLAYTMQDDCMDDEYQPEKIPAINFCTRKLSQCLTDITLDNHEFKEQVRTILNRQDEANAWELRNCRVQTAREGYIELIKLPDYGDGAQLAHRSLGHTISALGALYAAGYTAQSAEYAAIQSFMHYYLIARQISDDAHDWEEDLAKGHINFVASGMLQYYVLQNPSLSIPIEFSAHIDALRRILWDYHIIDMTNLILKHLERARQAIRVVSDSINCERLENLLAPIEASAQKSLIDRQKALDFIQRLQ